jgi:hypothetical protein
MDLEPLTSLEQVLQCNSRARAIARAAVVMYA